MWWKFSRDLFAANLEAQRVIALRIRKMAMGDFSAQKEAQLMVSEKVKASVEAATTGATGGSPQMVLRRYRTIMRANAKRLAKMR
ncbi:MAG: hypothetical protein ABIS49_11165 [Aestuariivirga sp.]